MLIAINIIYRAWYDYSTNAAFTSIEKYSLVCLCIIIFFNIYYLFLIFIINSFSLLISGGITRGAFKLGF